MFYLIRADTPTVSPQSPHVSVIVPFYNEEENIGRMHAAIVAALEPLQVAFEMVFVDDGSRDGTAAIAAAIVQQDCRVRLVRFRRNCGQTPAMAAGIEQARGDLVVGWRHNRQDKLITRKIPSRMANWLIGKVTGVPIRDNGCSLKAYRASFIRHIPLYSEMHRFIPAMASIAGPRIAEIQVRHHARQFGKSKYGLSRIYKVLLDMLVIKTIASFTSRPLLWFSMLAMPLAGCGLAALVGAFWTADASSGALPLPIAGTGVLLLLAAIVLFAAGALGELTYKLGDVREQDYAGLTARVWPEHGSQDRTA
jgi:glycosyltransferase involved in cell wall biosynthesis